MSWANPRLWESWPTIRALVVGTGRSGTGYLAETLTASGAPATHEHLFGWEDDPPPDPLVAVSWLAVPYLHAHHRQVHIWHQVRHPQAVMRSLLANELAARSGRWWDYRARHLPMTGNPEVDAARIYVAWNLACERWASRQWQVERITDDLVVSLCTAVGAVASPDLTVPADTNREAAPDESWTLDDMGPGPDRDAVLRMGARYGYL